VVSQLYQGDYCLRNLNCNGDHSFY
jgi:hypothetical protein